MSNRDVQLICDAYSQWARGEFNETGMFDPDVEFVMDKPEQRTYRGRERMADGWSDFMAAWQGFKVAAEEVRPLGDGRYLVFVHLHARGQSSAVETESRGANIVTLRGGKISRFELFFDVEEALERAGVAG